MKNISKFQSFASSELWTSLKEDLIEELAREFKDVSKPFKYGEKELEGVDAYYAKVGASIALSTLVSVINKLRKSEPKQAERFD